MEYEIVSTEVDGLGENAEDAVHFQFDENVEVPMGQAVEGIPIVAETDHFVAILADMEIEGRDAMMRGTEHLNEVAIYVSNEDGDIGEHVYTAAAEYEDVDVTFEDAANEETEYEYEDIEMADVVEPITLDEGVEQYGEEF